jgi:hypothetical protein
MKTIKSNIEFEIEIKNEGNGYFSCYIPLIDVYFSCDNEDKILKRANVLVDLVIKNNVNEF